jgi:hypothetical protein
MTRATHLLALAALLGCSDLTEGEAGIVAIEVTAPFPAEVTVGESVQLTARALDRDGGVVPAEISWVTPDATITVDSETGLVTGVTADTTGRVQAFSGSLVSALVTLDVIAPPTASTALPEALRRAP